MIKLNSQINSISSHIARWALPNEGIPLYMFWKGDLKFDLIRIDIPKDFVIREYYNIKKSHPNPREIYFDEMKTKRYTGFVFTAPIPESLSQDVKINLNFIKGSKVVYSQKFETRIVRPRIELELPDEIEIPSEGETKLDIKLKYSGYGNIFGKLIVSEQLSNLVFNVEDLRDFYIIMGSSLIFKRFLKKITISEEDFLGGNIPDDQYDYRKMLFKSIKTSEFTPKSFYENILQLSEDKKMTEILQETFGDREDIMPNFFKSVIELVEKRPVEGVFLVDQTPKSMELEGGKRKLFVCFAYIDNFGNYYCQIKEIPVSLEEKKKIVFKEKWEKQAGDWEWLREKK